MHFLVGTDSVHTTASCCDYLDTRVTAEDSVTVLAPVPPGDEVDRRDAEDALNVANARLFDVETLETEVREGTPASVLLDAIGEYGVDEVVITARPGVANASPAIGSSTLEVLESSTKPVVVVPQAVF